MIGAVYILNYGWAYAGMWQVAKRVLPKVALERILFPSNPELFTYFEKDHVLAGVCRSPVLLAWSVNTSSSVVSPAEFTTNIYAQSTAATSTTSTGCRTTTSS